MVAAFRTGAPGLHKDDNAAAGIPYVTELDFTTSTEYRAEDLRPLREFGTNNVEGFSDNYIFGEYRNHGRLSLGHGQ